MLWPEAVNDEQIKRWNNKDSLFSKILENQFMMDKSILSRNWNSHYDRVNIGKLVLDIIAQEVNPEYGISILYYSNELHHTRLANDELNLYQLVKIDNKYYLQHKNLNIEKFKLDVIFNIIIDEPGSSPMILFKVMTDKSNIIGTIGFVLLEARLQDVEKAIAGIMQVVRMGSIESNSIHVFNIYPLIKKLSEDFAHLDEESLDQPYSEAITLLFIAIGLNNPVHDDYYKNQIDEIFKLAVEDYKKLYNPYFSIDSKEVTVEKN